MSWLHIARIPGPDGSGYWLVVPGVDDPLFSWGMATASFPVIIRSLPTFQGWLIPLLGEQALWSVIHSTRGQGIICVQCLHGEMPCESWVNIVTRRFEDARRQIVNVARVDQWQQRYEPVSGWASPGERSTKRRSPPYEAPRRPAQPREPPPKPAERAKPNRTEVLSASAATLSLAWPATKEQVTKAFRRAALKHHPDLGGTDEAFIRVAKARDELLGSL